MTRFRAARHHPQRSTALRRFAGFLSALLPALEICWCGEPTPPLQTGRIVLARAQLLEEPAVASGRSLYKPMLRMQSENGDDVVPFRLTVYAATAQLEIEIRGRGQREARRLERVDPSIETNDWMAAVQAATQRHSALLEGGSGFFWVEPAGEGVYDLTVVLAELELNLFWSVHVASKSLEGTLIPGLHFELVDDFFYLVVLGDSVQWGNGLHEDDKMSTLVSDVLEAELNKAVVVQRYAHSGATIHERPGDGFCEYNCFGEVPKVNTAILNQIDQIQNPQLIDLIIVDGCINDVNVANIVNPAKTTAEIAEMTQLYCEDGMALLLQKLRAAMPGADVVVTGYYQIVSPKSDVLGLNAWLESQGQPPSELEEELVPVLTANSIAFVDTAHPAIQEAIAAVNSENPASPLITFADPRYGVDNAVFAPEAWLWGMTSDKELLELLDIHLDLGPMDDVFDRRVERCLGTDLPLTQLIICLYASVGHPTPQGAQAYATAIVAQLRESGVLPLNGTSP